MAKARQGDVAHREDSTSIAPIAVRPITAARFGDLEALLRTNSITAGCWDMWPRRIGAAGRERQGYWQARGVSPSEANQRDLAALVRRREPVGLLAYRGRDAVGFISVGPRAAYPRIDKSKATPPVDDLAVWAIPCFYVHPKHRGEGVTTALLQAAVHYAARGGAPAVEGYPRATGGAAVSDESAFFGSESMFRRAGYRKVRGVRRDLPRGWAPRVTMRAECVTTRTSRRRAAPSP